MLAWWLVRGFAYRSRAYDAAGSVKAVQSDINARSRSHTGQPALLTWLHDCCWQYHRVYTILALLDILLLYAVFLLQAAAKRHVQTTDRRCSGESCLRACEACSWPQGQLWTAWTVLSAQETTRITIMAALGEDLLGVVNKLQDLVFNTIGNDSLDLPQIVGHSMRICEIQARD